jgi:hypothetical protein
LTGRLSLLHRLPHIIAGALLAAAVAAGPAGAQVPAPPPTAASLHAEVAALLDGTAAQWAGMVTPTGVFQNPFPADVANGHHSFVPPMLAYALQHAGERTGDARLVAAAERTWPQAVDPARASSFDMLGAAYAYRSPALSDARRAQLANYTAAYGIPLTGRRCLLRPHCWGNLKLVDALAVLAITGGGVSSADPAARLGDPVRARAAAVRIVNVRIGQVTDHALRAVIGRTRVRGTVLSDPPADPLAYHALTTFMLREAVAPLGPLSSRSARRATREMTNALAVLLSPDGDASYLGRGQGQTWVPAIAAGALAAGARDTAARRPARAARYLAGAQRALRRLAALHASPRGFQVVPGALTRATAAGIDAYAHTVAYNGLALFGLTQALDALAEIPTARIGRLPADRRLAVRDERATGLGIVSNGRVWLAVHKTATDANDLRHDFGALALKRRTPAGWVDLLAPRPLTRITPDSSGPALMYLGQPLKPTGFAIHAHGRTIIVNGAWRANGRIVRRAQFRWRLTRRGARLRVAGAHRGDRFRMLAFTPAGTGSASRRGLVAAGARWRFDRRIRVRRIPGYHSGPVEHLDALEARFTAPTSGRFVVTIGS